MSCPVCGSTKLYSICRHGDDHDDTWRICENGHRFHVEVEP